MLSTMIDGSNIEKWPATLADGLQQWQMARLAHGCQDCQITGNIVRWLATFADGRRQFQMASTIGR